MNAARRLLPRALRTLPRPVQLAVLLLATPLFATVLSPFPASGFTPPTLPSTNAAITSPSPHVPAAAYDCTTGAPLTLSDTGFSLDPDTLPTGTFPRTVNPHWVLNPGRIFSHSHWTKTATHYLAAIDHTMPALVSTSCSRDMEVDVYLRNGYVVLRETADGRGIFFRTNLEVPGGELTIGIIEGDVDGVYFGSKTYASWFPSPTTLLTAKIPGYKHIPTDGAVFTFGVQGFDIYAKFDHKEFLRFKEYRHMQPGRMSLKSNVGYGVRKIALRHLPPTPLLSDYEHGILDLRDFGLKPTRATGTIHAGSNQFVLNALPSTRFAVGDRVIVELGGEPGHGQRGTVGVGGAWPKQHYPTSAAMLADTSLMEGTFAWLDTDGSVWRWEGGQWHPFSPLQSNPRYRHYYLSKVNPLALRGAIVAISADGATLTLDKPAQAASSAATLYIDNAPVFNKIMRDPRHDGEANWPHVLAPSDFTAITPTSIQLDIPPGEYAIGEPLQLRSHPGWTIAGAGPERTKIFSPRGTPSANFIIANSPGVSISNFHFQGNARDHGYGLAVTETDAPQGSTFPRGILFLSGSDNSVASDLIVTDVFQDAIGTSYVTNVWARRVKSIMTEGLRGYVQWMFQWSDSRGGGCSDCSVESPTLLGGFEAFKSTGTTFQNCRGINAVAAANASGGYLYDSMTIRVLTGANNGNDWFSVHNPMVNINTNTGTRAGDQQTRLGGTIRNVTLIQEGVLNTSGKSYDSLIGITVNAKNPNVTILGGSYQAPDYRAPSAVHGALGINSTGTNLVVEGFRAIGKTDGHWGNINVTDGVVRDCIATTLRVKPGVTVENCQATQIPW